MACSSLSLVRHIPIDLLQDASADSFAAWLKEHPSVELISRDRGTTFADGTNRGAPQALQIADRWHVLHNLAEALEKVLARHHANLNQAFTPEEEKQQVIATLDQEALAHIMARSQTEQQRQARQERRRATFTRVQELSAQGWSGASIARMLGIHKKTAVKYAQAELFEVIIIAACVNYPTAKGLFFCFINGAIFSDHEDALVSRDKRSDLDTRASSWYPLRCH
jgi:transposase